MRHDVIVVGAGPAGSTTARECVDRGLSVLMLDKEEFPRDKPCGGGVTIRAARVLPFDIREVVERSISNMHLSVRQNKGLTRYSDEDLVYLTQRRHLDTLLAERAVEKGVEFRQKCGILSIERAADKVSVRTSDGVFEGYVLVAADGANGTTAKMAGVHTSFSHGVALEGNVSPVGDFPERWRDTVGIDVGSTPGGYGWIFPKGDHLNIGIGGWKYVGPTLKHRIRALTEFYGFSSDTMWGLRGYHLPVRNADSRLVDGNVLLVGDAGGLMDPLTGEGIFAAFWSGKTAARHIADYVRGEATDLRGYWLEVERQLVPELNASRKFHDIFNLAPSFFLNLERRTTLMWRITMHIIKGEGTYATLMENHKKGATVVDFLSDLTRVNSFLQRRSGLHDPAPPQRFFLKYARST